MIKIFITLLFFLCSLISLYGSAIDDLKSNPKVIVVHGEAAPESEKQLARDIYQTLGLDQINDLYDHIITDTYCLKHQYFYAEFHLIIIGTPDTNMLCRSNSEILYTQPALSQAPTNLLNNLNLSNKGLNSAMYGYYPNVSGIGYIHRTLNPFSLQAYNLAGKRFKANPWTAITISGTDSAGVTNAYIKMLDQKMLEGIVVPEEHLAKETSRFKLSKLSCMDKLPADIKPCDFKADEETLGYKGWIQGTLSDYAGLKKTTGVPAEQIFHLKYQDKNMSLMTVDEQNNTLLLIKYKSAADSLKALQALDKVYQLTMSISDNEAFKIYPCGNEQREFSIIRKGPYIVLENLHGKYQDAYLKQAEQMFAKTP